MWKAFQKIALANSVEVCSRDAELKTILTNAVLPPSQIDHYGRPLPGSGVVSEHPDALGFIRAIEIRKRLSQDKGEKLYSEYAEELLIFLKSLPEGASLFIVNIVTEQSSYEFAYCPQPERVFVYQVSK